MSSSSAVLEVERGLRGRDRLLAVGLASVDRRSVVGLEEASVLVMGERERVERFSDFERERSRARDPGPGERD